MRNSINYISSERLYLRILKDEDIDERFTKWFEDGDLMKYFTNTKSKITIKTTIAYLKESEKNKNRFIYGIFYKENDECIGTINLGPINLVHKFSDLTVLIGNRAYQGKGLAVEAIKLGNRIAFEYHDLRKLEGGMFEVNTSSLKAYTRSGWVIEGRLKGHYLEDGKAIDKILVGCFNQKYFKENE